MSMNNTKMMSPVLLAKFSDFQNAMLKANIPFMLTCVARTPEMQKALYAQGREDLATVNALRLAVDQAPITDAQNKKVTWTMTSKHVIDPNSSDPDKRLSHAFDIAITKNGIPTWDVKVDVNADGLPDYQEAGKIAQSVGLVWGGTFPSPDYPHIQLGV